MKTRLLSKFGRGEHAFNLIEVTLAVAITGIALITILGLLPTAIDASRRVSDETLASMLAADMLNWRRVTPYDDIPYFPVNGPALSGARPQTVTMTFDAMGNLPIDEYNNTNTMYSGAYFLCTYTIMDQPQFPGVKNVARVIISFEWPSRATSANRTKRYFASEYSRFQ